MYLMPSNLPIAEPTVSPQARAMRIINRVLQQALDRGHSFVPARLRERRDTNQPKVLKVHRHTKVGSRTFAGGSDQPPTFYTRCLDPLCGRSIIVLPDGTVDGTALHAACRAE